MKIIILLLNCIIFASCTTYSLKHFNRVLISLPSKTVNYDLEFIFKFTSYLHGIYKFNTFVTFSDKKREYNREEYILVRPLEQALMEEFEIPVVVWSSNNSTHLRYSIGVNNLIFVYISRVNDPILEVVSHTLKGIHYMPMIFIYKRKRYIAPTLQEIHKFFEWCWHENMLNVALTFQVIVTKWSYLTNSVVMEIKNEVFNYTPFPKMSVYNVTDLVYKNKGNFIKDYIKNLRGYKFKTPMFEDSPNVFLTHHGKHGSKSIRYFVTGTTGRTFHEYIHFVNGSLQIRPTHNVGYYHFQKKTLTYASQRLIDIGIHPYSSILPYANLTEGSYPIGMTNACIIVPVVPEIAHGQYVVRALPLVIWLLWLMELISLFIIQCIHLGRLDIGDGIIYSFRTLMCQSLNVREFQKRRCLLKMLHLFVLLLSVLVNSSFCASLASILSTTLQDKQITTIDDLLASGLQIITTTYEKEVYFDSNLFPPSLKSILYIVSETELQQHKESLNTSYAYVLNSEEWGNYNFQQQLLGKQLLRIAHSQEMCSVKQFLRFPIQWDSPFANSLERFIIYAYDSGLKQAWHDWSIYLGTIIKLMKIWKPIETEDEMLYTMEHFLTIFIGYLVMMLVAIVCFMAELMWFNRKSIMKIFNRK